MTSLFSEESLLVAKNWETVADIFNAVDKLRSELNKLLRSLEADLVKQDWWNEGWKAFENRVSEAYISNERWRVPDSESQKYVIWIGVENFSPEHIFGQEKPPSVYVWVADGTPDLARQLAKKLEKNDCDVEGEIDTGANRYVVWDYVKKCLPEEVETYGEVVRPQIIQLLSHYAKIMMDLDPTIQNYLKTK